jgi:pyruvate/2-oxoglutarate dehydrogenase complex dihydrolipoamide acyltransferase (E2) component
LQWFAHVFRSTWDPVTFGEPLIGIDTDNVTLEIRSPVTGVLSKILVKDGAKDATARYFRLLFIASAMSR